MEKQKTEKLFHVEQVGKTPFAILEQNEKVSILIGNQITSEKTFKEKKDAIRYIMSKPWELISAAICIYAEKVWEMKKLQENNNQKTEQQ